MVLCPVAIASGCRSCPVVGVCLLKSVIGDYGKTEAEPENRDDGDEKKEKAPE